MGQTQGSPEQGSETAGDDEVLAWGTVSDEQAVAWGMAAAGDAHAEPADGNPPRPKAAAPDPLRPAAARDGAGDSAAASAAGTPADAPKHPAAAEQGNVSDDTALPGAVARAADAVPGAFDAPAQAADAEPADAEPAEAGPAAEGAVDVLADATGVMPDVPVRAAPDETGHGGRTERPGDVPGTAVDESAPATGGPGRAPSEGAGQPPAVGSEIPVPADLFDPASLPAGGSRVPDLDEAHLPPAGEPSPAGEWAAPVAGEPRGGLDTSPLPDERPLPALWAPAAPGAAQAEDATTAFPLGASAAPPAFTVPPVPEPGASGDSPPPRTRRRARKPVLAAVGVAAALVAGVSALFLGGGHQGDDTAAQRVAASSGTVLDSAEGAGIGASPSHSAGTGKHGGAPLEKHVRPIPQNSPSGSATTPPTNPAVHAAPGASAPGAPVRSAAEGNPGATGKTAQHTGSAPSRGNVLLCVQGSANFRGYVKLEGTTYDGSPREYTLGVDANGSPTRTSPGGCDSISAIDGGHYQVYLFYIDAQHVGRLVRSPFEWASTMGGGQNRHTVWELTGSLPQPGYRTTCDRTTSCPASSG